MLWMRGEERCPDVGTRIVWKDKAIPAREGTQALRKYNQHDRNDVVSSHAL